MKAFISIFTLVLLMCVSALAILPLEVHIIRDVAELYEVQYVTSLPKEVIFGCLLIIGLLKINIKQKDLFEKKEDEDEDEYGIMASLKAIFRLIIVVIVLLLSWWFAYIVHSLNHF